jgi:hypothetical protein
LQTRRSSSSCGGWPIIGESSQGRHIAVRVLAVYRCPRHAGEVLQHETWRAYVARCCCLKRP